MGINMFSTSFHRLNTFQKICYLSFARFLLKKKDRFFFEGCRQFGGQLLREERKALFNAILEYKPRHCFEIGTFNGGGSTFFFASAFASIGKGKIYTLECDPEMYNTAKENYKKFRSDLLPYVEFIYGDQVGIFKRYIDENGVDCVFLDGAEDQNQTLLQYEYFKKYFKPGSLLMAHDWNE